MKIIIAGGRNYRLDSQDYAFLNTLRDELAACGDAITEVLTGGACGADDCGYRWARNVGILTHTFWPDWTRYGNSAGPRRNREMARHVGATGILVLFPGGRGSASMRHEANREGLLILEPKAKP